MGGCRDISACEAVNPEIIDIYLTRGPIMCIAFYGNLGSSTQIFFRSECVVEGCL